MNADEPYLGASPDGIGFCQCHGQGIREIKCPYTHKAGCDGFESDRLPIGIKNCDEKQS